jgi:hypothetical protein
MSFIFHTYWVPNISVSIHAFPHYMLNLLPRRGRRCRIIRWRVLGVCCPPVGPPVVFGVFRCCVSSWESFSLLQDNYSCNKYTICDMWTLYYTYIVRMCDNIILGTHTMSIQFCLWNQVWQSVTPHAQSLPLLISTSLFNFVPSMTLFHWPLPPPAVPELPIPGSYKEASSPP